MDILKASNNLSRLDLQIDLDNYLVKVLWFRIMDKKGEWSIKRHTHSSFEFHFVKEGSCRVVLDDDEFEAKAGEIYLTPPGVYHAQKNAHEDGNYLEYSINCDFFYKKNIDAEAEQIYRLLSSIKCKAAIDKYAIMEYFYKALEEAYYEFAGYYSNIKSLASVIIVLAVRALTENKISSNNNIPQKYKKDDYRFMLIQQFIEDNLCSNICTIDIASYMFLSDKQVYRIVKEKTGESTKKYINTIRLRKAKELLKDTELNIRQISEMLGFSSEYYFSQFFKREEGFPPSEYRDNIQNV